MAGLARLLLPKEHGTYGEVLFPLATALLLGNRATAAWAAALAALAGYLGHEAFAVVLGQRGARARREGGRPAILSLALFGGVAVAGLVTAWIVADWRTRLWLVLPLVLSVLAVGVAWAGRERSTGGESLAGAALASWGVPVAIAGGVPPGAACATWAVWVVSFVASTLAVRGVIAKNTRRNPRPLQLASILVCIVAMVVAAAATFVTGVSRVQRVLCLVPTVTSVVFLLVAEIPARRLRAVGWTLIVASAVTMVVLVLAFRSAASA